MAESLEAIAQKLVEKPKGILAMDESSSTIQKRFDSLGIENTEENRRAYREMIITTRGLGQYVSGVILFEETLAQKTRAEKPEYEVPFVQLLECESIIPGIKVDKGLEDDPDSAGEQLTKGLEDLPQRLKQYAEQGAQFTKWRAVIHIRGNELPTARNVEKSAKRLAQYAILSQEAGLVPIVEPEVLMDGDHSLERCLDVTKQVLTTVFRGLAYKGVNFEGMILKPNMVVPGEANKNGYTAQQIADATVQALLWSIAKGVPGIAFLSGGLSDEKATAYLSEMNMNQRYNGKLPFNLTFSFGRGLQREPLKKFAEGYNKETRIFDREFIQEAQRILLKRAEETSLATLGKYEPVKA